MLVYSICRLWEYFENDIYFFHFLLLLNTMQSCLSRRYRGKKIGSKEKGWEREHNNRTVKTLNRNILLFLCCWSWSDLLRSTGWTGETDVLKPLLLAGTSSWSSEMQPWSTLSVGLGIIPKCQLWGEKYSTFRTHLPTLPSLPYPIVTVNDLSLNQISLPRQAFLSLCLSLFYSILQCGIPISLCSASPERPSHWDTIFQKHGVFSEKRKKKGLGFKNGCLSPAHCLTQNRHPQMFAECMILKEWW